MWSPNKRRAWKDTILTNVTIKWLFSTKAIINIGKDDRSTIKPLACDIITSWLGDIGSDASIHLSHSCVYQCRVNPLAPLISCVTSIHLFHSWCVWCVIPTHLSHSYHVSPQPLCPTHIMCYHNPFVPLVVRIMYRNIFPLSIRHKHTSIKTSNCYALLPSSPKHVTRFLLLATSASEYETTIHYLYGRRSGNTLLAW